MRRSIIGLRLMVAMPTSLSAAKRKWRAAEIEFVASGTSRRPHIYSYTETQSINNIIVLHLATTASIPLFEVLIITGICV